jgi:uncharacterized membrane protein
MNVGDERLDRVVSAVLRSGVLLSAALVLAGGLAFLASHRQDIPDFRKFHAEPTPLASIHGVMRGALALDPPYIIQLGLLILIATPVVRVLTCATGFAFERDWTYAVVSLIVLALLIAGVGFGL